MKRSSSSGATGELVREPSGGRMAGVWLYLKPLFLPSRRRASLRELREGTHPLPPSTSMPLCAGWKEDESGPGPASESAAAGDDLQDVGHHRRPGVGKDDIVRGILESRGEG